MTSFLLGAVFGSLVTAILAARRVREARQLSRQVLDDAIRSRVERSGSMVVYEVGRN